MDARFVRLAALSAVALTFAITATPAAGHAQSTRGASAAPRNARARRAVATKQVAAVSDSTPRRAVAVAVSAPVDFSHLVAAMAASRDNSNRFARSPNLRPDQIALVDVRNLLKRGDEQSALETALGQHERDITAMRATLQSSYVLRDLLYARQLAMSQVIAVDFAPDGRAGTVFYRPE